MSIVTAFFLGDMVTRNKSVLRCDLYHTKDPLRKIRYNLWRVSDPFECHGVEVNFLTWFVVAEGKR